MIAVGEDDELIQIVYGNEVCHFVGTHSVRRSQLWHINHCYQHHG